MFMNKRIYDLDFIEWLLKNVFQVKGLSFPRETEQLVFAGLAASKKSFVWNHSQIKAQYLSPHQMKQLWLFIIHIM